MALRVRKLSYRPWPVTVLFQECDEATGQVTEIPQTFIGHFKPFTESELLAHRLEIFGDETKQEVKDKMANTTLDQSAKQEAEFFARLMCGWSKVSAEDDADLAFSPARLRDLCTGDDGAAFRRGINSAIGEIRFGIGPLKNSVTSPAPGPTPAADEAAPTS